MKNIIFIATVQMMMLTSCLLSSKDYPNGSNDDATASDTPVPFTEVSLISDIDEYVSDIRENIEEASITKQQVDGKLTPDDEYLRPVEHDAVVADRAYVQAQHWSRKEQAPDHYVNQVLLTRLFHPNTFIHIQ